MGCRDRGFFAWKEGRAAGRRSFVEDCVARDIVELSTMSVGTGRAELVVMGQGRGTDMGLIYAVGVSLC